MNDTVSVEELKILKERFREADCKVKDLDDSSFEITGRELAVRTHVLVTPYYLQLGTMIMATPQGFLPRRKSKLNAFLCVINARAKLVKFTCEENKPDEDDRWRIVASVKLITGVTGCDYDAAALKNMVTLWYQDIAELMSNPAGFELSMLLETK